VRTQLHGAKAGIDPHTHFLRLAADHDLRNEAQAIPSTRNDP